ncbi:MAG: RDD family protein [gamma proteobacterium symbiont of Taylorina sp.]|nr:RDD family protein [gamma proteobacterium symbiont of Taylorina sp.]
MTLIYIPDMTNKEQTHFPAASFLSLIGCWLYDTMLLCAVWLLAGFVYIIPAQLFIQMDSTHRNNLSTSEFTGPIFYSYLFIVSWFFFAWFWTHGGQTLGLKSWSLRLQTIQGNTINWTQSLLRFLLAGSPWMLALFLFSELSKKQIIEPPWLYAIFLIGFTGIFWVLIDKKNRSLQDIFSATCIVKIPRPKNQKKQKLY